MNQYKTFSRSREDMVERRKAFRELFQEPPSPRMRCWTILVCSSIARPWPAICSFTSFRKKILGVHGHVMEFSTRWGQNLALLSSFRRIYEPHTLSRKIVGFDTFSGFPELHEKDGDNPNLEKGGYAVKEAYKKLSRRSWTTTKANRPYPIFASSSWSRAT